MGFSFDDDEVKAVKPAVKPAPMVKHGTAVEVLPVDNLEDLAIADDPKASFKKRLLSMAKTVDLDTFLREETDIPTDEEDAIKDHVNAE